MLDTWQHDYVDIMNASSDVKMGQWHSSYSNQMRMNSQIDPSAMEGIHLMAIKSERLVWRARGISHGTERLTWRNPGECALRARSSA
jgi:hypothetical protein